MEWGRFTRRFKLEAVKLIQERGVTVAQAAQDLGVHGTVLRRLVPECAVDLAQRLPLFPSMPQVRFLGRGQARPPHLFHHDHPPTPLYARGCCIDRLNLPRPTSRRRRCEVRLCRDAPGNLAGGMDGWGARCLTRRPLYLADPAAECPGEGQRTAAGQGAGQLPHQQSHLRCSAGLARHALGGNRLWPPSHWAAEAICRLACTL